MDKKEIIEKLTGIVGTEQVITEEQAVLDAAKDYIGFRRFQRDDGHNLAPRAACVVRVKNTEEVSKVVKFLNDNKIDVAPRTGGSSVTLGLEPQEGGVILDGSEMNEIIEINETDMYVTAKCGTPLEYLEKVLNEKGYTAGHFPQSLPLAQIGGLLATRSIGQLSTLYGGIEDLVIGLEAVLADGSVIRIKNVPRRSVGPDLRQLFIGSEGMLGFITEATLKIFRYRPEERWMNAYCVKGMENGLNMLRDIMVAGYKPAVARLHDPVEVERILKIDGPEGMAMLLFMAEGPESITRATGNAIGEIAAKYNALDLGSKPVEHWLVHRNDAAHEMDDPTFHDEFGGIIDTCEISANWSVISKLYDAVTKRLEEEIPGIFLACGHSSHSYMQGTNLYFEFGFTVDDYKDAQPKYMSVIKIIMEETLKYGGSIAHHHGSGKYRTAWMPQEHGTSYPLMYKLKEALDPNGIFNKGVLLVDKES